MQSRLLKCKDILLDHFNLSFGGTTAAPQQPAVFLDDTASNAEAMTDKLRDDSSRASTPNSITATTESLLPCNSQTSSNSQTSGGLKQLPKDDVTVGEQPTLNVQPSVDARPYEFSPLPSLRHTSSQLEISGSESL